MDKKSVGVMAILAASAMWALEPVFAKLAYTSSDVLHTVTVRSLVVAFVAVAYLMAKKANPRVERRHLSVMIYLALVGTCFADLAYLYSLTKTSVANAVILGHMQPIFILIFGYFLLNDKLTKHDYFGITMMIVAGVLAAAGTVDNLFTLKIGNEGDVFAVLATIGWATTTIAMSKYLKELNAGVIAAYRFGIASLIFILYISVAGVLEFPNPYQLMTGIAAGIGTIFYYEGLKRLKAVQVSALELSSPIFAAVLAFFALGEGILSLQAAGILFLIVGLWLLSRKEAITRSPFKKGNDKLP